MVVLKSVVFLYMFRLLTEVHLFRWGVEHTNPQIHSCVQQFENKAQNR